MQPQAEFGFKELFSQVIGDMAKAVCERTGETKQQQIARSSAAVHAIMGFLPRDVIEAMLAGHCLMFHELIVASVLDTLRGEPRATRRATRGTIVAMDKAFGNNLSPSGALPLRPSEGRRDVDESQATESPPVTANPPPVPGPKHAAKADKPAQTATAKASPEAIAACQANPEAMAALTAGDPDRFARALGVTPGQDFLTAAASPGSPFNGTTRQSSAAARSRLNVRSELSRCHDIPSSPRRRRPGPVPRLEDRGG